MKEERSASARPNIAIILVDDMGFSDIGCYGSEIRTPNIDRLAAGGVRFTHAYNCARCCPTRASLLTGVYPHQAGVGHMTRDDGLPGYLGHLGPNCVTIAEVLKGAGYRTLMSGKWHVGGDYNVADPTQWAVAGDAGHPIPTQRGFDEFYGFLCGATNYFDPDTLMRNDRFIEPEGDDFYLTDAISEEACRMAGGAMDAGDPFFLYLAYNAPHWPLHARTEDIAQYDGVYRKGWDALRTARHETQKAMGLIDPKWAISPRDEGAPPWSEIQNPEWEAQRMATYAAMVESVDRGVGQLIETLEARGQLENTLILFLSDNGGCAEFLCENGATGKWPEFYGKQLRAGGKVHVGNSPAILPGPAESFMSYDLPWANASDTPFRKFKLHTHEGGIATPLVAHYPRMIRKPAIRHEPCHVIDFMATCIDLAGTSYPAEHAGRPIAPLQGESLRPVFEGRLWDRERPLYFEHEGNRAVHAGAWKLVATRGGAWELYHMIEDRTELHDLASGDRDRVRQMSEAYARWCTQAGVVDFEEIRDRRKR